MKDILAEKQVSDGWAIRLLDGIRYVKLNKTPEDVGFASKLDQGFTLTYGPDDTTERTLFFIYGPKDFNSTIETLTEKEFHKQYATEETCEKCSATSSTYLRAAAEPLDPSSTDTGLIIVCQDCVQEFQAELEPFLEDNSSHVFSKYV